MFSELVPFGMKSLSSLEPAKDLIFPTITPDSLNGNDLYKRSHGSYGPGEQRTRDYNWPVNPKETRFGRKGDTIAMNGVSTNINEVLKASVNQQLDPVNLKKVSPATVIVGLVLRGIKLGGGFPKHG